MLLLLGVLALIAGPVTGLSSGVSGVVYVIGAFVILLFYPILFEVLAHGQTPGKRMSHLRVLRDSGAPVDLPASAIRNLMRLIDGPLLLYHAVDRVDCRDPAQPAPRGHRGRDDRHPRASGGQAGPEGRGGSVAAAGCSRTELHGSLGYECGHCRRRSPRCGDSSNVVRASSAALGGSSPFGSPTGCVRR